MVRAGCIRGFYTLGSNLRLRKWGHPEDLDLI